jgi:4-hydroxy-tetrahydrodipicolinate reductase
MGQEVLKCCKSNYEGAVCLGGIDLLKNGECDFLCAGSFDEAESLFDLEKVDCIVDFSHHLCVSDLCKFGVKHSIPLVVATTGLNEEETALLKSASEKIPVFHSANMSLGVALLISLAKTAAANMKDADIEIIEKHHNRKVDAPSGTAKMLFNEIKLVRENAVAKNGRSSLEKRTQNEIGIHAVRMGNVVGEHEVILCTPTQSITLKHEAFDRALFAEGALVAAKFICSFKSGFYTMNDIVNG